MINEKKIIKLKDGTEISAQISETGSKCWVIAVHGIGEHLGRHSHIPELLGHKFNILQYDLRGHGASSGERGAIDGFFTYVDDLRQILEYLQISYRMERYFLFGHSMGALITAALVQKKEYPYPPEMIFLSAPPVAIPGALGKIVQYAPLKLLENLASFKSGLNLGGLVDLKYLSNDVRVSNDYVNDPLNCLKLHTTLILGLAYAAREVFSKPLKVECPAYCVAGGADHIINVAELKEYFTKVEKGFQLQIFEGGYHELHNEIEKYRKKYFSYIKDAFLKNFYNE